MTGKRWLSQVEAVRHSGISDRAFRNEVAKGNIQVRFYGKKKVYDVKDVDAFFLALPAEATRA